MAGVNPFSGTTVLVATGYRLHPLDPDLIVCNDCNEWYENTKQGIQQLRFHRQVIHQDYYVEHSASGLVRSSSIR